MERSEAELLLFVADLKVSSSVEIKARKLLQKISSTTRTGKVQMKTWVACAIYVAVQDICSPYDSSTFAENRSPPEVTVSQLLLKADINIMDFFYAMCCLKTNYPLSNNSKQSLIALERKYCIVSALYDKFDNMINEIFCADPDLHAKHKNFEGSDLHSLINHHKSLCWMLFLVAKAKVLWHRQELLATFHLLLCCIAEVIKATPTFLLLPPFDNVVANGDNSLSVLEVLSNTMNTRFEEVKVVYDCWLHVTGELMPESTLPEVIELKTKYTELYLQSGDVDESNFLERDWHLVPSSAESCSSPRKNAAPTIRRTLDTAQALNSILNSAPDDLSPALKTCFKKCTKDPTSLIQNFIQQFKEKFVAEFQEAHGKGDRLLAQQRYKLATRYYYLMLDSMLRKEAERLSVNDFTTLLHNETFHRSLLACCTEVIIMSCGSVASVNFTPLQSGGSSRAQGINFPWVLIVFELKAYHFFKVIESFIKAAPTITQQIIKHLKQVEDKILETLAWASDSPVFSNFNPQNNSNSSKSQIDSSKSSQSLWSPDKEAMQMGSQNSPPLSHAVNIFLNKVSRMAYRRMEALSSLLKIKDETLRDIWICIEHVIYKKSNLLKDRHLDQIIMCCIYAVCKVLEQEVRFKTIIASYVQLPHATDSVYKQVLTDCRRDFIVVFYNHQFTNEMQEYILNQFSCENRVASCSLSAVQSPITLSPAYSLPGRRNIFISPLRQSPFKNPNEIIHQPLVPSYSFGSLNQSSKKLKDINEALKILHPSSKSNDESKGKKRLQFDSDNDCNSKPESDVGCAPSAKKFLKFDQSDCSSQNHFTPKPETKDNA